MPGTAPPESCAGRSLESRKRPPESSAAHCGESFGRRGRCAASPKRLARQVRCAARRSAPAGPAAGRARPAAARHRPHGHPTWVPAETGETAFAANTGSASARGLSGCASTVRGARHCARRLAAWTGTRRTPRASGSSWARLTRSTADRAERSAARCRYQAPRERASRLRSGAWMPQTARPSPGPPQACLIVREICTRCGCAAGPVHCAGLGPRRCLWMWGSRCAPLWATSSRSGPSPRPQSPVAPYQAEGAPRAACAATRTAHAQLAA